MSDKPTDKMTKEEKLKFYASVQPPQKIASKEAWDKMTDLEREEWNKAFGLWCETDAFKRQFSYPLIVKKLVFEHSAPVSNVTDSPFDRGAKPGNLVQIRSCKTEHGDKTRLGILIGWVPLGHDVRLENRETDEDGRDIGTLVIKSGRLNPAIFVPDLGEIVLGCESWWGPIKNEEELRQITDGDIQNIWYVKALKQLSEAKNHEPT